MLRMIFSFKQIRLNQGVRSIVRKQFNRPMIVLKSRYTSLFVQILLPGVKNKEKTVRRAPGNRAVLLAESPPGLILIILKS